MFINRSADLAAASLPADLQAASCSQSSSSNVLAPAEKVALYPRELTQMPAYIDHVPAKRPKSPFSTSVREGLSLTVLKKPDEERTESVKIIKSSFRSIAAQLFSKAA